MLSDNILPSDQSLMRAPLTGRACVWAGHFAWPVSEQRVARKQATPAMQASRAPRSDNPRTVYPWMLQPGAHRINRCLP
ncbi:hypothetical protein EMIT048CA2_10363 [Pseudomonas chlororaphis]